MTLGDTPCHPWGHNVTLGDTPVAPVTLGDLGDTPVAVGDLVGDLGDSATHAM